MISTVYEFLFVSMNNVFDAVFIHTCLVVCKQNCRVSRDKMGWLNFQDWKMQDWKMRDWNLADSKKTDCKFLNYMDIGCTILNNASVDRSSWAVHSADNELSLITRSNSNNKLTPKMYIRRHTAVANGQCSYVEMEYTTLCKGRGYVYACNDQLYRQVKKTG